MNKAIRRKATFTGRFFFCGNICWGGFSWQLQRHYRSNIPTGV